MANPEPSPRPREGELPAKVTSMKKELEAEIKEELEAGRLRQVPESFATLGERFEVFRSMLWQLATFFQGALEYPNQIDFINQATRLAQQELMKEAFNEDGLVVYAKRQHPLRADPKSVTTLQRQIQKLALGAYAELDSALSSASKLAPAYWDWVVEHPNADVVKTNPQQKLHVEATGKVKRCLVTYSAEFGDAVDTLVVVLEAVQGTA
jgi:hypothetical protein